MAAAVYLAFGYFMQHFFVLKSGWVYNVVITFIMFDLFLLLAAILMAFSVKRIWQGLAEQPELIRNQKLMILHLAVYSTFICMFLANMIIYIRAITMNGKLDKWWYIFTTLNTFDNAVNQGFLVYLTYRFANKKSERIQYQPKS